VLLTCSWNDDINEFDCYVITAVVFDVLYRADRCVDHMPMIENLRSHVQGLEKALKAEKDKSTVQQ